MATTTVKTLAEELKRSTDNLLEQLRAAGISKNAESDVLSENDKQVLLEHLQKSHGTVTTDVARKKITLTKRETSEIRQSDSAGRTRTVQVEVRKKRVIVKHEDGLNPEVTVVPEPIVQEELPEIIQPIISEAEEKDLPSQVHVFNVNHGILYHGKEFGRSHSHARTIVNVWGRVNIYFGNLIPLALINSRIDS